jgi:heme exporter protein D
MEQRLWAELADTTRTKDDLPTLIADIAYGCWMELLDAMAPSGPPPDLSSVTWQTHSSLEKNVQSADMYGRMQPKQETPTWMPNWQGLLDRLHRQVRLASLYTQPNFRIEVPQPATSPPALAMTQPDSLAEGEAASKPEQDHHSLNRVTYLGGILLPFTVVSGILSMSDDFAPGGSMFYVFWAVSIPITLLTLLIIYADSIRRLQVWVEVASEQASDGNGDVEAGEPDKISTPPHPEVGVPFRLTQPVPISSRIQEPVEVPISSGNPAMHHDVVVQQRFANNNKHRSWKKEELGWIGAGKTILQLYKLKGGRAPPQGTIRMARRAP